MTSEDALDAIEIQKIKDAADRWKSDGDIGEFDAHDISALCQYALEKMDVARVSAMTSEQKLEQRIGKILDVYREGSMRREDAIKGLMHWQSRPKLDDAEMVEIMARAAQSSRYGYPNRDPFHIYTDEEKEAGWTNQLPDMRAALSALREKGIL